jgi:uncharacterized phage protein gp47/JayE
MKLSRREVMIGAGAVVATTALPSATRATPAALRLDAWAAQFGIIRQMAIEQGRPTLQTFCEDILQDLQAETGLAEGESDASLRARLIEYIGG